jgi:hypothetical protein
MAGEYPNRRPVVPPLPRNIFEDCAVLVTNAPVAPSCLLCRLDDDFGALPDRLDAAVGEPSDILTGTALPLVGVHEQSGSWDHLSPRLLGQPLG